MARSILSALLAIGSWAAAHAADSPVASLPAGHAQAKEVTDLLEQVVGWLHHFFPGIESGLFHWLACGIIVVAAILLRRLVTNIIFNQLKKLAAKTESTLDDKLFPAIEGPAATLVMVLGIFAALTVLPLAEHADQLINNLTKVTVLGVVLWGLIKAGGAILDHLEEVAHRRNLTVATFMPLIKKTLLVFSLIVSVLLLAESLGANVGVFLASLGIGGLAFALAAQDTIANLFGSFVVVMDQPFRVGDVVKIGTAEGQVEDIGLRSTKIRTGARTLIIIPNRSVAHEPITNFTRMPQRRVDQTIGLTGDTTPEQMVAIVKDIQQILRDDPGVHKETIGANFAGFGPSSLDIQIVYFAAEPNWQQHMELGERINLAIMQTIAARGLSLAFPTPTVRLAQPGAKLVAGSKG